MSDENTEGAAGSVAVEVQPTPGRVAYDSFRGVVDAGVPFPHPPYDAIPERERLGWEASATGVLSRFLPSTNVESTDESSEVKQLIDDENLKANLADSESKSETVEETGSTEQSTGGDEGAIVLKPRE